MKSGGGAASARDAPRTMHPRACPVAHMRQEASKRRPEIGGAAQVLELTSGGGEIRTSRGRRPYQSRNPCKSADFRAERGEVRTAAQSQNDPQEPNLT